MSQQVRPPVGTNLQVPVLNKEVDKVIVPEKDHHSFSISHPNHLLLIASPLASEEDIANHEHSHPELHDAHHELPPHDFRRGSAAPPDYRRPSMVPTLGGHVAEVDSHADSEEIHEKVNRVRSSDQPILKRAHEASTIQLFFDLYFVANLTTFSSLHEISSFTDFETYLGYFVIIWFTWFQNTLFDVRFSNDSAFERVCKALQFGIMTGFAVVGPGYRTGWTSGTIEASVAITAFKALSYILMGSRLILTMQYSVALFWMRKYKGAIFPMVLHLITLFTMAMIFLGLTFAFDNESTSEKVLIVWYVLVAIEAVIVLGISGKWKFLSFRSTVLVERLGLLTLIILGEGIIGMCKSINLVGADGRYGPDVIGQIICSVAITYLLYMLYFDNVQPERMGTFRQLVWAVLHFIFHVGILLVVECVARVSLLRKIYNIILPLIGATNDLIASPISGSGMPSSAAVAVYNNTLTAIFNRFTITPAIEDISAAPNLMPLLNDAINAPSLANLTATSDEILDVTLSYVASIFDIDTDSFYNFFYLFRTIFIILYVFAGSTLIILGMLFLLGKRHKLRGELLSVLVRYAFGLSLCMIATMAANPNPSYDATGNFHAFLFSPWLLPLILLVFLATLVIDNVLIRYVKKVINWRMMHLPHLHHAKEGSEHGHGHGPKIDIESAQSTPRATEHDSLKSPTAAVHAV